MLDLSLNSLTGSLPLYWASLLELEAIDLSNNHLQGSLPATWSGLRSLKQLDLHACRLTGELPATWFGLREVRSIDLSGNLLDGLFPVKWGMMGDGRGHKLRRIDLSNNPCMNKDALQRSIAKSRIEATGKVVVDVSGVGQRGGSDCA